MAFKKHAYDIQGELDVTLSINQKLDELIQKKQSLNPTTVILIEIPTNPGITLYSLFI